MKKNFIVVIALAVIHFNLSGQDSLLSKKLPLYIKDNKVTLSPTEIIQNFKPTEQLWLFDRTSSQNGPFLNSYMGYVFDYFYLNDEYRSDLQRKTFIQTQEYKTLFDSLKSISKNYINSIYYDYGFNEVWAYNDEFGEWSYKRDGKSYVTNYNIQKQGFEIPIGEVKPYQCSVDYGLPKVIREVEFKQLHILKKYNIKLYSERSYNQYLFIPMDEATALEMERSKQDIEFLRVFEIKGIYIKTFNDEDFLKENKNKTCKRAVVEGGNMRLIIYNKNSNKIYFDKLYLAVTKNKN